MNCPPTRVTEGNPPTRGSPAGVPGGPDSDGADQLEDAVGRKVLFEDPRSKGSQGVGDGVAHRGRSRDHAALAHPAEVDVGIEGHGFQVLDLDPGDVHGGRSR